MSAIIVPKNTEIEPTMEKTFQHKQLIQKKTEFESVERLYQKLAQKVQRLENEMIFAEPITRLNLEYYIKRDKEQLLEYDKMLDKLAFDIQTLSTT